MRIAATRRDGQRKRNAFDDSRTAFLEKTGHYNDDPTGVVDEVTLSALRQLVGEENLEERWNGDKKAIDNKVVEYLRGKFS